MIEASITIGSSMIHPSSDPLVLYIDPANPLCFTGTTAITDLITPARTGNFQSVPTLVDGIGLQMTNNYATLATDFDFGTTFTCIIWFNPGPANTTDNVIISNLVDTFAQGIKIGWNTASNFDHYIIMLTDTHGGGGSTSFSTDYGNWQQMVWTINSDKIRATSYQNAVPYGGNYFNNWDPGFTTSGPITIGALPPTIGHNFSLKYMNGILGSIKVYNKELNSSEILAEFNATKSIYGL